MCDSVLVRVCVCVNFAIISKEKITISTKITPFDDVFQANTRYLILFNYAGE